MKPKELSLRGLILGSLLTMVFTAGGIVDHGLVSTTYA